MKSTPQKKESKPKISNRLLSLDALRGYTIAGMIVVNTPGSWSHVYEPLKHASWHGLTPTDLVFPFFLFIMGVSVVLSMQKQLAGEASDQKIWVKIVIRVAKIFLVGIFLNLWYQFDLENIRIAGVLQRIAIVYGVCAALFLISSWKIQAWITAALLVGYTAILHLVPVPMDEVNRSALETGTIVRSHGTMESVEVEATESGKFLKANIEPATNLQAWMDRNLLPGRKYEVNWDPEGLLSTLPAIVTGLLGMLAGALLVSSASLSRRINSVFLMGVGCLVIGILWSWYSPINKNLWSSAYVLVSGGCSLLGLATCMLIADDWGFKKWAFVGKVFGSNAIVAYALAGMLWVLMQAKLPLLGVSIQSSWMDGLIALGVEPKLASFTYALFYTSFIFALVYPLYRKRIFVKL